MALLVKSQFFVQGYSKFPQLNYSDVMTDGRMQSINKMSQFFFGIPSYHRQKVASMLNSVHVLCNKHLSFLQAQEIMSHVGPDVSR